MMERTGAVDARLEHYERYIVFMKDSLADMYADREAMTEAGRMIYPPTDTREYELTRAFASDDLKAKDFREDLRFFSNMERVWAPIARENEGLITTMYLGTTEGLLVSYDRYSYLSYPPKGRETIYNYFYSEWYRRGMKEDGDFCTGVYMDSQGRGLTITIGSVFRDGSGEPAGVVCIDFDLSSLYDELFTTGIDDGAFIFALDPDQNIISPDADTMNLQDYTGLTLDEMDALRADPDGVMETGDSVYVCIPMERLGWTICASVPKSVIRDSIHSADQSIVNAFMVFMLVVLLILIASVVAVNRAVKSVTYPLELLGRDIKIISDGDLSYRATVHRNDEIGDITSGMNEMVDRLNFTLNELMSSQQHADAMSRLATLDTLTGIRNKTAFDERSRLINEELANERSADGPPEFGFAMIDLNNLKVINDNYGHNKGDIAIRKLCKLICDVFEHSPVFRVGGDEFVVLLENDDYRNAETLVDRFRKETRRLSEDVGKEPWVRISAAIGCALYDPAIDTGTKSVLARADSEMYECKKSMKGLK